MSQRSTPTSQTKTTKTTPAAPQHAPVASASLGTLDAAGAALDLPTVDGVLTLQRQYGNRAARNSVQRKPVQEGELDATLSDEINRTRGGGSPLPTGLRGPLEQSFGSDFSTVRVHTDQHADTLNRSVQAKAFTLGSDIYFRKGNYQPGNSGGQELLAHELTHVVQQGGGRASGVQTKLTLGPVGDRYEQEADRVAKQVVGGLVDRAMFSTRSARPSHVFS